MKIRMVLSTAALTLLTAAAFAGLTQPAPVIVNLDMMFAQGDQVSARTAKDDVTAIGCGIRTFEEPDFSIEFGFCQATDSDGVGARCFTENPKLLDTMKTISDFAFISFSWQDDGNGGAECTRVGTSTQSFYDPNFTTKGKK